MAKSIDKSKITYHDIAEFSGLGVGTVSRYFNNYNISAASRKKIDEVLKKIDYVPNYAAASIRKKVRDVYLMLPFNNDETANMEIVNGVKSYFELKDVNFFVFISSDDSEQYQKDLDYLISRNPYAVILLLPKDTSVELENRIAKIKTTKLVTYNKKIADVETYEIEDYEMFKRLALKVSKNYQDKNILYIGLPESDVTTGKLRKQGFKENLTNNRATFLEVSKNTIEIIRTEFANCLQDQRFDIFVCGTHTIALTVNDFLTKKGIREQVILTDIGRMGKTNALVKPEYLVFIDYFLIGCQIAKKLLDIEFIYKKNFEII
ncbi:LacI family DNA-binding transcriptional regulator [Mesoplasma seiffertii]|uniref:LacI family DNA-binding transcriptional regulator n=1 Tax=Mesoplasma seiffertii TaxID=28224 RepID=UPI00047C7497|nr:LacI family DNA-binding transcriptional regulator [Mesoplasma seiffertii]